MGWVNLYNVPSTPETLSIFSFENQTHHRNINQYLISKGAAIPTDYVLDPLPLFAVNEWLNRHQQVHNTMNSALNLNGSDLTAVNFQDTESLSAWIAIHAREHYDASTASGV